MFELLWLLLRSALAWARPRQDLVLENLLLRHQLAILTRPARAADVHISTQQSES